MRIWFVPLNELSDMHILGQHRELHLFCSMLHSKKHFKNHPMVLFFKDKKPWVYKYHDAVVEEIKTRWYKKYETNEEHKTPLLKDLYEDGRDNWNIPESWIEYDKHDLANRYQTAPEGKYKWTNRAIPEWASVQPKYKDIIQPLYLYINKKRKEPSIEESFIYSQFPNEYTQ